ncbi:MAG TPA: arginine--tRNA ligase [Clostridiaceae bacterium]|nr:arginine--tRNA ligase [Clostridiaceae bacterium]
MKMIDYRCEIAKKISDVTNISKEELANYIEKPKNSEMGDYAFPCFKLAKELKKAPAIIAEELKNNMDIDKNLIEKVEIVGGYLNFYINKESLAREVIKEFDLKKEKYGSSNEGENKNVVIDYSSPNIAKPFHIGHLRSTVIGQSLYNIYKFLGYNSIGINHLGDWGTQFGKLIEGYKRWGKEYNIDKNPIDELTKLYVRINEECKKDESVLEECRNNFKKLEDGDKTCVELWEKFRELSLNEFQRIYDILGTKFESVCGESFYTDKMPEIVEMLEKSGKLIESQGAKVVDLEEKNMPPCIIIKSNKSTTYETRDLAAILYRARTYDFCKAIYVTSYEQILHFEQIFEVAKLLDMDEKYKENLVHVPFGMVRLKEGKMSTREGNIIKLEDLLNEAVSRVEKIIEEKNPELENKKEIAKKVGIGAVIFNDLSNSRIKDEIFDWDTMLNFNGETGPYIQYIYVRTKSVLNKAGYIPKIEDVKIDNLLDKSSMEVLKLIYSFNEIVKLSISKNEPYIIARFLIDLAKAYSVFYTENQIMIENTEIKDARIYLTYMVNVVLETGANLLGIQMPERM